MQTLIHPAHFLIWVWILCSIILSMTIILFCRNGHDLSKYDQTIHLSEDESGSTSWVDAGRYRSPTIQQISVLAERSRRESLQPRQPFCSECGAPTLDACQDCKSPILKGHRPAYCGQCGKPFPWTEISLTTAREYTDELDELSSEDKLALKATFADLTVDSPKTEIAANRFKKILLKLAPDVAETIRKTIVEIASTTAVKLIKG